MYYIVTSYTLYCVLAVTFVVEILIKILFTRELLVVFYENVNAFNVWELQIVELGTYVYFVLYLKHNTIYNTTKTNVNSRILIQLPKM